MPVQDTARRYHCGRCHQPVVVCRQCDRGNVYCFNGCAQSAFKQRCQRNARCYQRSTKGRHKNAQRQRRYRLRRALTQRDLDVAEQTHPEPDQHRPPPTSTSPESQKVTHRGSATLSRSALLLHMSTQPPGVYCNACFRVCNQALRIDFLRTPRHRTHNTTLP